MLRLTLVRCKFRNKIATVGGVKHVLTNYKDSNAVVNIVKLFSTIMD